MTREELDIKAEAAARNAKCDRCAVKIMESPSYTGAMVGTFRVSVVGVTEGYQLCGRCGLYLREFLRPGLRHQAHFQGVKMELLERWS